MYKRIRMLVRLLTCFLILMAVAVQRNGSIFGHDFTATETKTEEVQSPVTAKDGAIVINTTTLTKEIKGYGGPVPLEIIIENGKISDIKPLKNSESGDFFERVRNELIPQWLGTPVSEVAAKKVDAVSGATLSSNAFNSNIKKGVAYAMENSAIEEAKHTATNFLSWKYVAVLIVVLCAAIIPLFFKNRYYRYVQLLINVIVLGFWSGTFLSFELFINYIANGTNLWSSLAILLMLVIAFIYPYFGKKSHYCTWVCPLGSLQELCGKSVKYKVKITPGVAKGLAAFQEYLWFVLVFLMIAGIWSDWINYELFRAFLFKSASIGVLIAAGLVLLLSFIIPRPYCRFVCPTGYLFQTTQNPDK